MFEYVLVFTLGVVIGSVITNVLLRWKTGLGYFRVTKVLEEEDLYTVNIRLEPDQQLQNKKKIILTREHSQE